MDLPDLGHGLLSSVAVVGRDRVPAGGLPVRGDRDRSGYADRRMVAPAALAAADHRDAPCRLRAHPSRVPVLRTVFPRELPRVHRGGLHTGAVPGGLSPPRAAAGPPGPPSSRGPW